MMECFDKSFDISVLWEIKMKEHTGGLRPNSSPQQEPSEAALPGTQLGWHSTAQHSSVLHPGRKHILTVSFRDVNQHISNGCSTFFHQKRGLTPYFHQFPLILLVLEDLKINPLSYLVWFWSLKWFEMSFFSLFSLI